MLLSTGVMMSCFNDGNNVDDDSTDVVNDDDRDDGDDAKRFQWPRRQQQL